MNSIRLLQVEHAEAWARLRQALWPDADEPAEELVLLLSHPERHGAFGAFAADGTLLAFVEVSLRPDPLNLMPVDYGFVEGWYVLPEYRRRGIGAALVHAAEAWARQRGCTAMGSDTEIGNELSQRAHAALGYREVERVICFRKRLD